MNTMQYEAYQASIEFDEKDGCFYGIVTNTRDVLHFEGCSVAELKREFKNTVEAYKKACTELGREAQRPFSGKFQARLSPDLHRSAAATARQSGRSLNAFVEQAITHEIERAKSAGFGV